MPYEASMMTKKSTGIKESYKIGGCLQPYLGAKMYSNPTHLMIQCDFLAKTNSTTGFYLIVIFANFQQHQIFLTITKVIFIVKTLSKRKLKETIISGTLKVKTIKKKLPRIKEMRTLIISLTTNGDHSGSMLRRS